MGKQGAFGLDFKITVSSTLTTVANLEDLVDLPTLENILDDVTNHASTSGAPEYLATGLKEGAEFTAVLTWDVAESTHAELVTLEGSGAANAMTIANPDDSETMAFNGIVKTIQRKAEKDKALRAEVTIQVTGAITIS